MNRVMNIQEVMQHLPQRFPFLLIDRVLDWSPHEYLTAIKNVSINEPFFQGHFPIRPIMPGVLIAEAMAQATGILAFASHGHKPDADSLYMLVGLDNVSFRRMVEPGDQLILHVRERRMLRGLGLFDCEARVGDELAASGSIKCIAKEVAP